jgi:hypothetical protein
MDDTTDFDPFFEEILERLPKEHVSEYKRVLASLKIREGSELAPLFIASQHYLYRLEEFPRLIDEQEQQLRADLDAIASVVDGFQGKLSELAQAFKSLSTSEKKIQGTLNGVISTALRLEQAAQASASAWWGRFFIIFLVIALCLGMILGKLCL